MDCRFTHEPAVRLELSFAYKCEEVVVKIHAFPYECPVAQMLFIEKILSSSTVVLQCSICHKCHFTVLFKGVFYFLSLHVP